MFILDAIRHRQQTLQPSRVTGNEEARRIKRQGVFYFMAGYRNNYLQNAGADASPEEINDLIQTALDVFQARTPDLHNPEEVRNAIINYFTSCQRNHTRPGNLGLYAALGMSRQDYNDVIRGKNKSKVSPECIDILKKAVIAIGQYREGLALEGKINPVTYIFMGKNYDGLQDQTQIEVTAQPGPAASMTPEEIARQIEKDIPIDAEYTETDK